MGPCGLTQLSLDCKDIWILASGRNIIWAIESQAQIQYKVISVMMCHLISVSILVRTMPAALKNKTVVYSNNILGNQAILLHVDIEEISRNLVVLSVLMIPGISCVQVTGGEHVTAIDFYSSCLGGGKGLEATSLCEVVNIARGWRDIIYSGVATDKVSTLL